MKSFKIGPATIVAVALMVGPLSAQDTKGGAAPGGAAPAAGGAAGGERILPQGGAAGQASPGMKPAGAAQPEPGQRMQGENTGVAPDQQPKAPGEPATEQKKPAGQPGKAEGQAEPAKKPSAESQGQEKPAAGGAAKPAGQAAQAKPAPKITTVQQTKIQQTIRNVDVRPINVNFNVGVGVAVPNSVVLTPLPPAIITIVPDYEGYRFFVVPGQIVIVDPVTLEIVAVLPL